MKKRYSKKDIYYIITAILLFGLLIYISFHNLGSFMINDWDESRHGVSAYEMLKNKNYVVNTYNYSKDYWNLKPPLSFWMIMINFKLFGASAFSLRFYSAASIVILAVVMVLFLKKRYNKLTSIIWLFLFCACMPIYYYHMGRNGDADALALLFLSLSMISMLKIEENIKNLYLAGLFFSLVFLTKSWHALSIVAVGGLYLIFTGIIKKMKVKEWIYFLLSFIIPIVTWGALRYINDGKKFFIQMIKYDLLKRSSTGIEGNVQGFFYYFKYLIDHNLFQAVSIALLVVILLFVIKKFKCRFENIINSDKVGYLLWIFVPLLLFSISKTKLDWYVIPIMIPVLAVTSIIFSEIIYKETGKEIVVKCILFVFIMLNVLSIIKIVNYVNNPVKDELQSLISSKEVCSSDIKGYDAYIDVNDDKWSQSMLFLGEINNDFKCIDGGINSYLSNDGSSVLLTTMDKYKDNKDLLKDLVLTKSKDNKYIIISKK